MILLLLLLPSSSLPPLLSSSLLFSLPSSCPLLRLQVQEDLHRQVAAAHAAYPPRDHGRVRHHDLPRSRQRRGPVLPHPLRLSGILPLGAAMARARARHRRQKAAGEPACLCALVVVGRHINERLLRRARWVGWRRLKLGWPVAGEEEDMQRHGPAACWWSGCSIRRHRQACGW